VSAEVAGIEQVGKINVKIAGWQKKFNYLSELYPIKRL
jgi:hypothetical protein